MEDNTYIKTAKSAGQVEFTQISAKDMTDAIWIVF